MLCCVSVVEGIFTVISFLLSVMQFQKPISQICIIVATLIVQLVLDRRMGKYFTTVCVLVLIVSSSAINLLALPQYTLFTGNRCINCHVNFQGGGLRNELGWYSYKDVSLVPLRASGLDKVYSSIDGESNTLLDGKVTLGVDFRMQGARKPAYKSDSEQFERKIFPMQASLHASVAATDWALVEGTYNAGPKVYGGQQAWSASVQIQPNEDYPQLRAGFFQPSFGVRYDDHTMLVRQNVESAASSTAYGSPIIAPYFSEWGAELNYHTPQWLSLTAGVFGSSSLSEVFVNSQKLVNKSDPMMLVRAHLWDHQLITESTESYAGASYAVSGNTTLTNVFAGIGYGGLLSLMGEMMLTQKTDVAKINNSILALHYQPLHSIMLEARAEKSLTTLLPTNNVQQVTQYVLGAQIFVLPYIVLRPDYRWLSTEDGQNGEIVEGKRFSPQYNFTRFNMQLQLWY